MSTERSKSVEIKTGEEAGLVMAAALLSLGFLSSVFEVKELVAFELDAIEEDF